MKHTSDEMLLRKMDPMIKLIWEILCIPSLEFQNAYWCVKGSEKYCKKRKKRKENLKCV